MSEQSFYGSAVQSSVTGLQHAVAAADRTGLTSVSSEPAKADVTVAQERPQNTGKWLLASLIARLNMFLTSIEVVLKIIASLFCELPEAAKDCKHFEKHWSHLANFADSMPGVLHTENVPSSIKDDDKSTSAC